MAELSELVELWKSTAFPCRKLEIENCQEKNVVLFSSQERGISRYNLQNRRIIQSWPVLHGQNFTAPVVFQEDHQRYVAVTDEKMVYTWSQSEASLSNATVNKLNVNCVRKLHPLCVKGISDLVFVEKDGSVHLYSSLNENSSGSKPQELNSSRGYIWSNLLNHLNEVYLVVILTEDSNLKVVISSVDNIGERIKFVGTKELSFSSLAKGCHLISVCLQDKEAKLITIWSDHSLCVADLKPKLGSQMALKENDSLDCQLLQKIPPCYKLSGRRSGKARLASMANDLVVIASKMIKDDKSEGAISIWSTRYGTEQIRYPFPLMSEKDALKKEANILNLACFHNYIVLALSTSTLVCSYQLQTPSLAGVIGKLKLPSSQIAKHDTTLFDEHLWFCFDVAEGIDNRIQNTMTPTSPLLEPPLLVPTKLRRPKEDGKFEKKIADSNNEEKRVMERLSDPLKTPTLEDFSKELDRYLQKLQLRATKGTRHDDHGNDNKGDDVETPKKKRRKTSETKHERSIVVPEHITEAVLLRCLSDKRIWSTDIISKIIKTNCVPSRLCPELLEKLLEHDLLALMQDCFRNIKGISEKCVALCVKHLMRLEEEKTQLKNSDQQSEKNSTRTEKISQKTDYTLELLSDIIKYPCDELSLQDALKDLTLAETKLLLQALHLLLLQNPQSPSTERIDLSYEKIIDWTSMVVSAHFTSLILSKEMVKLIRGIQNTVQGQLRLCKNLRSLEPYLRHFKNRYRLPDVEKVGVYTIETLKL